MIRSEEEVIERLKKLNDPNRDTDMLGFQREVLLEYLPFGIVSKYVNKGWVEENKDTWAPYPLTEEKVLEDAAGYMEFAWEKVLNHRGLSANRSVEKMMSYCWLLGCEDSINWDNYPQYGAPILDQVCWKLGLNIPNEEKLHNMIKGLPCEPGCQEGCSP